MRAKAPQKLTTQALHAGIREHEAQGGFRFGVGLAADLQEVRRAAAAMADHIHGGHGEAGAVGQNADISVELDELEPVLEPLSLQFGHRLRSRRSGEFALAEGRGVVEGQLAVERHDTAIREERERIDFDQLGIDRAAHAIERGEDIRDGRLGAAEVEPSNESAGGLDIEALIEIDKMAPERVGARGCNLLDIHAALRGEQHKRAPARGIDQDGGVEFPRDLGPLLQEHRIDPVTVDRHPEDRFSDAARLLRRLRGLDAAGLAALARRHLRLDHAGSELREGLRGGLGRLAEDCAGHRNAGGCEHPRLGDVFQEVHRAFSSYPIRSQCGPNRSLLARLVFGNRVSRGA